jgi:hypothetical protein
MIDIQTLIVKEKENITEEIIRSGNFQEICGQQFTKIAYDETKTEEEFENFLFNYVFESQKNKNIYLIYLCYPNGKQINSMYTRDRHGKYTETVITGRSSNLEQHGKIIIAIDTIAVFCMKNYIMKIMEEDPDVDESVKNQPDKMIEYIEDQTSAIDESPSVEVISSSGEVEQKEKKEDEDENSKE